MKCVDDADAAVREGVLLCGVVGCCEWSVFFFIQEGVVCCEWMLSGVYFIQEGVCFFFRML